MLKAVSSTLFAIVLLSPAALQAEGPQRLDASQLDRVSADLDWLRERAVDNPAYDRLIEIVERLQARREELDDRPNDGGSQQVVVSTSSSVSSSDSQRSSAETKGDVGESTSESRSVATLDTPAVDFLARTPPLTTVQEVSSSSSSSTRTSDSSSSSSERSSAFVAGNAPFVLDFLPR